MSFPSRELLADRFLSYIGPGAVYLGVHGAEFIKLADAF